MEQKPEPNEAPRVIPMVRVPSGAVLRIENANFISRQEINKYGVFYPQMGNAAIVTLEDIEALIEFGIIQDLPKPTRASAEAPPKLVTA